MAPFYLPDNNSDGQFTSFVEDKSDDVHSLCLFEQMTGGLHALFVRDLSEPMQA